MLLTGDLPDDILFAKAFVFKTPLWNSVAEIPDMLSFLNTIETASNTRIGGGECACSNWFMSFAPGSALMELIVKGLELYWRENNYLVDYFIFHFMISYAIATNESCRREFVSMPNYVNVKPHILLFNLYKPFDLEQWNQICACSVIHKLTYKGNDLYNKNGSFLEAILTECVI